MIIAKGSLNGKVVDKQNLKGNINTTIEYIKVYPETQTKTITPTKQTQTVLPDENIYALSQVTVNPIPNNYIEPQGQKEITENGIYDVTNFASANVEIEMGKLTNEEYTEANDDLDDILEGNTPITIYPPDWSEIGYEDTPQGIIDGFNYAKEIQTNWDSSITNMGNMYNNDRRLKFFPYVDTQNVTIIGGAFAGCHGLTHLAEINTSNCTSFLTMFSNCTTLQVVPNMDTSKATNMASMFSNCFSLITLPILNTSSLQYSSDFSGMFTNCPNLSNESLNNILASFSTFTKYTSDKTLKKLGLTSAQATICQGLSNYQAFLNAGWTTGY